MLDEGVDVIIGTTGRLIDFAKQGRLDLSAIQVVVLDEADRMYDLGFIKDIRWLFRHMPPCAERMNLLFSATLSYRVRELAFEQMNNPEYIEIEPEQRTGHRIKEELFYPSNEEKCAFSRHFWKKSGRIAALFSLIPNTAVKISGRTAADGHRVGLLTGDVAQKNVCVFSRISLSVIWIFWWQRMLRPVVCISRQ